MRIYICFFEPYQNEQFSKIVYSNQTSLDSILEGGIDGLEDHKDSEQIFNEIFNSPLLTFTDEDDETQLCDEKELLGKKRKPSQEIIIENKNEISEISQNFVPKVKDIKFVVIHNENINASLNTFGKTKKKEELNKTFSEQEMINKSTEVADSKLKQIILPELDIKIRDLFLEDNNELKASKLSDNELIKKLKDFLKKKNLKNLLNKSDIDKSEEEDEFLKLRAFDYIDCLLSENLSPNQYKDKEILMKKLYEEIEILERELKKSAKKAKNVKEFELINIKANKDDNTENQLILINIILIFVY